MTSPILDQKITDRYAAYHGDCVEVVSSLPDNSIDFIVFSPPFASLYTYSASERDMGNVKSEAEFAQHYRYLSTELMRVLKPEGMTVMASPGLKTPPAMRPA